MLSQQYTENVEADTSKIMAVIQAQETMAEIFAGQATPAQIAAFLTALRMKGETADEIAGCADAMRKAAISTRRRRT